MGSFDAEKLSGILIRAQGERTRQRYAMDAGISLTFLSNLIRKLTVGPPSPATLRKLADASGGATTYEELMEACGHQGGDPEEELKANEEDWHKSMSYLRELLAAAPVELDGDTFPPDTAGFLHSRLSRVVYDAPLFSSRKSLLDFLSHIEDPLLLRRIRTVMSSFKLRSPSTNRKPSFADLIKYALDNRYTADDFYAVAAVLQDIQLRDARRG